MRAPLVSWSSFILLAACSGGPEAPFDEPALQQTRQALGEGDPSGDSEVYGSTHQGRSLTGEAADPLVGVAYQGVALRHQPVLDVSIVRGRLLGRLPDGQRVEGRGWRGAVFRGKLAGGGTVELTIDSVRQPHADIDLFTVLRLDPSASPPAATPFCAPDLEGNTDALVVAARWSQDTGDRLESQQHFTFACRSGVIAKCIGWGYAPWPQQDRAPALLKAHQACTRAARADYCGNGQTNTRDGTEIGIFDRLAPQVRQDVATELEFEGAWDDNGVHCLTHLRWQLLTPECPVNSDPARPLGPYQRDPLGNVISPRTCDTPKEATTLDPTVIVFTESVTHALPLFFDLPTSPTVPDRGPWP